MDTILRPRKILQKIADRSRENVQLAKLFENAKKSDEYKIIRETCIASALTFEKEIRIVYFLATIKFKNDTNLK